MCDRHSDTVGGTCLSSEADPLGSQPMVETTDLRKTITRSPGPRSGRRRFIRHTVFWRTGQRGNWSGNKRLLPAELQADVPVTGFQPRTPSSAEVRARTTHRILAERVKVVLSAPRSCPGASRALVSHSDRLCGVYPFLHENLCHLIENDAVPGRRDGRVNRHVAEG